MKNTVFTNIKYNWLTKCLYHPRAYKKKNYIYFIQTSFRLFVIKYLKSDVYNSAALEKE